MRYEAELVRHLRESGIRDEEFIEQFLAKVARQGNIENEFDSYVVNGEAESWLGMQLDAARLDYDLLWSKHGGSTHKLRTESGEIRPRRPHRDRGSIDKADPWERQEALGKYLARFAADHPDVRRFRSQLLGGKTLTAEEARELISSPYAASRPLSSAQRHGRNVLRSPLSVQGGEDEDGWPCRRVTVRGKTRALSFNIWPLMSTISKGLMFPGDVVEPWDVRTQRWLPDRNPPQRMFLFPHPEEEGRYVVAKEKSILAELWMLSESALRGYPIATDKGPWFVVTGEFIPMNPVRILYEDVKHPDFRRSAITIEAESWMSPEEVAEHYRYAQKHILGKTPRSLEAKSLDVFNFVNRSKERTWEEHLKAWNKKNPTRRFGQRAHLYQAYNRALQKIVSPDD